MKIWIIRLILFIIMAGLLLYMGHRPTEWEYWAVIGCGALLSVISYFEGRNQDDKRK